MNPLSIFSRMKSLLSGSPAAESGASSSAALVLDRPEEGIETGRYCRQLRNSAGFANDPQSAAAAWKSLEAEMAMVPAGETLLGSPAAFIDPTLHHGQRVRVNAFYVDRCAVTNAQFARFVADGGYLEREFWPAEMLVYLLQFTDETGQAGPRFWSNGEPPHELDRHPVTGVCWYEANAYAMWAGKRLPSPAEWQWSGCWSGTNLGEEVAYPWGNSFDSNLANTWLGGPAATREVDAHYEGATPNGVYQLVGNVWEWVDARFEFASGDAGYQIQFDQPMAEVRGGAFDTYFKTQATCQFRTGQPLRHRAANVGFRCCLGVEELPPPPDPSAFI